MIASAVNWSKAGEASLEVHLLGLVDFDACLHLQERLVEELSRRDDGHGAILVCEHPPLITVGRDGSRAQITCNPEELAAREIEVRWLSRGGGCLFHAPGQLAVYPIIPLDRRGLGLADYRERLEGAVIDACGELRVPAWRQPDLPGVWCRCGQLAHLGVAVKSWISFHGVFVNVCPSPEALRLVRPEAGSRVTSLAAQRQRPTSMHSVRESIVRCLAARLNYDRYHLYTGHPLLRRTKRIVAYA